MDTTTPSYDALTRTFTRLYHLQHLEAIASWDQAANMPPAGNEARAAAMAEMSSLLHRMVTDPQLARELDGAEADALTEPQRANHDSSITCTSLISSGVLAPTVTLTLLYVAAAKPLAAATSTL